MSDACDEAESDEEDAGSSLVAPFPKLSIEVFRASFFDKVVKEERRNTWGCAGGVGPETSDTTGSSFYSVRANRRRRVAQSRMRESRWLAFSMLLQPRLGEQSLWKLSEDVTRSILEKTEKTEKRQT